MKTELIAHATTLAIELLKREPMVSNSWTTAVIATAFHTAYSGLEEGIRRVEQSYPPEVAKAQGLHM